MATHSSTLAWRIPCTKDAGGIESKWLHRVGHDCVITDTYMQVYAYACVYICICSIYNYYIVIYK